MANLSAGRLLRQARNLPLRLQLWLGWLIVATMLVPLALLDHAFFAAFMLCQAANIVVGTTLALRHGLVRLLSLSHLLFWTPMLGKFAWYYDTLGGTVLVIAWIVIATVAVSLIFDVRDYRQWLAGRRDAVG